jgi:hypothetical protein
VRLYGTCANASKLADKCCGGSLLSLNGASSGLTLLIVSAVGALVLTACGSDRPLSASAQAFADCDAAASVSLSDPRGDVRVRRLVRYTQHRPPVPVGWVDVRRARVAVVESKWLCVQITTDEPLPDRPDYAFYADLATGQAGKVASLSLVRGGAEWAPPGAPEIEPVTTFFRGRGRTARYAIKIGTAPTGIYGMSFDSFRFAVRSSVTPGHYRQQAFALVDCVPGWRAYPGDRRVPAPAGSEHPCVP